jgi:hypothetical protein
MNQSSAPAPSPVVEVTNVHFVDQCGSNFLFRGAEPLIGSAPDLEFNYCGLKDSIAKAATAARITLPESYRLVDISLYQLENTDEIPKVQTEYEFFKVHPDKGEFHFWETNGTSVCAIGKSFPSTEFRNWLAVHMDHWMGDTLVQRIETLRIWLEKPGPATVIFAHCHGGDDRTGELMGAYYMRWLKMSWEDMNALNQKFAGQPFGCNNYRATLWYCIYLVEKLGYSLNYNKPFDCNGGQGWGILKECTPDT